MCELIAPASRRCSL